MNDQGVVIREESLPPAAEQRPHGVRFIFFGPDGLRAGWGLLLWIILFAACFATAAVAVHLLQGLGHHPKPTPEQIRQRAIEPQPVGLFYTGEIITAFAVLFSTWVMAKIERRPIGVYGFGGTRRAAHFAAGFVWGVVFLGLLVGVLWKAHLLALDGRLLFGWELWKYAAIWLVGFLLVAVFEEGLLRGYLQYTAARGLGNLIGLMSKTPRRPAMGFWAAAIIFSFLFGFIHKGNPGESPIGLWSAGVIGLIFCWTLWRTGSLWWALGFHASWDWAQSFVFGVADSGMMVKGHLLGTHPVGNVLWSGGATGPEGSLLVLPVLALIAGVVAWTIPDSRSLILHDPKDEPSRI